VVNGCEVRHLPDRTAVHERTHERNLNMCDRVWKRRLRRHGQERRGAGRVMHGQYWWAGLQMALGEGTEATGLVAQQHWPGQAARSGSTFQRTHQSGELRAWRWLILAMERSGQANSERSKLLHMQQCQVGAQLQRAASRQPINPCSTRAGASGL